MQRDNRISVRQLQFAGNRRSARACKGYYCLMSLGTKKGDIIGLFCGSDVPLIIREHGEDCDRLVSAMFMVSCAAKHGMTMRAKHPLEAMTETSTACTTSRQDSMDPRMMGRCAPDAAMKPKILPVTRYYLQSSSAACGQWYTVLEEFVHQSNE